MTVDQGKVEDRRPSAISDSGFRVLQDCVLAEEVVMGRLLNHLLHLHFPSLHDNH